MFAFESDDRSRMMDEDEVRSWWTGDVLGWMRDKLVPYQTLTEQAELPSSPSPGLVSAILSAG